MSAVANAPVTPPAEDRRLALHRKRKLINAVALVLSLAAMTFGLFWLLWILWETLSSGSRA